VSWVLTFIEITSKASDTSGEATCTIMSDFSRLSMQLVSLPIWLLFHRPDEPDKFSSAEILAIDEAAAIPLPIVKALLGDRLTFMSSTINGYEGTGRALSLKLIKELRDRKARNIASPSAIDNTEIAAGNVPSKKRGEAKMGSSCQCCCCCDGWCVRKFCTSRN
jgi:tRNA(Met) C34 N-acetyltransferase TmcA